MAAESLFLALQAMFFALIFLHRANIWLVSIPSPTITYSVVGMYILLLSIAASKTYFVVPRWRTLALFFPGLLLIVLARWYTAYYGDVRFESGGVLPIAAYVLITMLALMIVLTWNERKEQYVIRFYIVVCSFIALCGTAAWGIVMYDWFTGGYVDPKHFIDINYFTGGQFIRNEGGAGSTNILGVEENIYSFPHSLGLVLTSSYLYEVAGLQLFRASGIFHEPVYNWILIIPAFLLTLSGDYFKGLARAGLLSVQIVFLVAISSLSIFVALVSVLLLAYLFKLRGRGFTTRTVLSLGVALAFFAGTAFFIRQTLSEGGTPGLASNLIASKFQGSDYVSIALGVIGDHFAGAALIYLFVVGLVCLWAGVKSHDKALSSHSMVVLACLIVSLKGAFSVFLVKTPGFLILFYLMLRHRYKPRAWRDDFRRKHSAVGATAK